MRSITARCGCAHYYSDTNYPIIFKVYTVIGHQKRTFREKIIICLLIWNGKKIHGKPVTNLKIAKKGKVAHWPEMARNAIKNDFQASTIAGVTWEFFPLTPPPPPRKLYHMTKFPLKEIPYDKPPPRIHPMAELPQGGTIYHMVKPKSLQALW